MRSRIAVGCLMLALAGAAAGAAAQTPQHVFLPPVRGIFLTPIPNAPFSGTISVQRTAIRPDGGTAQFWSVRRIARDSQGRIYNEFRPLQPASVTAMPPVMTIHLYDPQSRQTEYLYPQSKVYTATLVNRPPRTDTTDGFASPSSQSTPPSDFTKTEDLGYRTMDGVEVHGVRVTQTLPPDVSGTGSEVVVTDEYWYSANLRLNLEIRHNDPRSGSVTMQVTDLNSNEPDPSLFTVPADYRMGVPGQAAKSDQ